MKQITILANSTRDQEGYSDTQMGVSLDIECELTDVGSFIVALKELDKEFKELYPHYTPSNYIEPDLTYRTAPNCHMFYRFDFSRIANEHTSTLHNISSLMSAYAAYRVAYVFRGLGYDIVDDSNNPISNREVAKDVCRDQEESFLEFISSSLYEIENLIEYDFDNDEEFLAQFDDKDFKDIAMKTLANEVGGEFGFSNPIDQMVLFKDYNPFATSEEVSKSVSDLCKNIKYSKILSFFQKNIL